MQYRELIQTLFVCVLSCASMLASAEDEHDHDRHEQGQNHTAPAEHEHDNDAADHQQHSAEQEQGAHADEHEHGDEEMTVALQPDQLRMAGIEIAAALPQRVDFEIYAPGEIKANGYTSYIVSPRTASVVLKRHVALGEHVEAGQPLVTLFSEAVTDTQAAFQVSAAEWRRVRSLGRKAVGEKRFIEAKTSYESARGRLIAYGMSREAIADVATADAGDLGAYTLTAATHGVVLSDGFSQGQRVDAGQALMEIADEGELWVEARLPPGSLIQLHAGGPAHVQIAGERFPALVAQEAHTIDPRTRTRVVRLIVGNEAHRLHPGMFADVYFQFTTEDEVLVVPEEALMRSEDGHWTVFMQEAPGEFIAVEVELGQSLGELREIKGVAPGTSIVTRGAFFVASQLAKGGFDPHNH